MKKCLGKFCQLLSFYQLYSIICSSFPSPKVAVYLKFIQYRYKICCHLRTFFGGKIRLEIFDQCKKNDISQLWYRFNHGAFIFWFFCTIDSALEYLCEKPTCTTTISRISGRGRKKLEGQCQKSEKLFIESKDANSHFHSGLFLEISSDMSLTNCRYTHYDENGHRIDERVSNERYTSQFDSDPVDSAFGNSSSSSSSLCLFFQLLILLIYSFSLLLNQHKSTKIFGKT